MWGNIISYFQHPAVLICWSMVVSVFLFLFIESFTNNCRSKTHKKVIAQCFLFSTFFGWAIPPIFVVGLVFSIFYLNYKALKIIL
jgi:type II secretory pathway component PulF